MTELWTCPHCGRQFANRNQAHSHLMVSLDDHLDRVGPDVALIYQRIEAALRDCGEFRIHPQQTRIAFINTMTFASVRLGQQSATLSLITPEPIEDDRVEKVDLYGPTSFASELRISEVGGIDTDLHRWLCTAYERGLQETLDPSATVEAVTGATLERLRVPLASKVVTHGDELGLSLPRYAVEAFGAHPLLIARLAGSTLHGEIDDAGVLVVAVASLGLGEGDPVDVTLTADL